MQSQSGTMDNYVVKIPHVSSSNNEDVGGGDNNDEYVDEDGVNNTDVNNEDVNDVNNEDVDDVKLYYNDEILMIMMMFTIEGGLVLIILYWMKRDKSIKKGPKDKSFRRFTAAYYTRILPNNEKCNREWLVYSKELDKEIKGLISFFEEFRDMGLSKAINDAKEIAIEMDIDTLSITFLLLTIMPFFVTAKAIKSGDNLDFFITTPYSVEMVHVFLEDISLVDMSHKIDESELRGGNANMAFDLRPTKDVLQWPGNANMAFALR
ncbi:hypothetical protein Tco_1576459 [Tanacetum coccineum]